MFDRDKKPWWDNALGEFPPHKPAYTPMEDTQKAITEMRNSIDRLLKFENHLKNEVDGLMKQLTSDNVIFKETYAQSYNLFIEQVKTEVNEFEANVDNTVKLFENAMKADYEKLSADTAKVVEDNYNEYVKKLNNYIETLNESFTQFKTNIETLFNNYKSELTTENETFRAEITRDVATAKTDLLVQYNNCKKIIDDAVLYMKTNLVNSISTVIDEMRDSGEFAEIIANSLIPELSTRVENIEGTIANVRAYGATGDGLTDDTLAFATCLQENNNVYVPEGTYLINSTLSIADFKRITGDGSKSIIKYTGGEYLFNVSTPFSARAEISSLTCEGTGANKFVKCAKGSWGGSVLIENVSAVNFAVGLHLISVFNVNVKNSRIYGVNTVESVDGDVNNTFSNVNMFENVYFDGNSSANLFNLSNARSIMFTGCTFEHATTAFKCVYYTQKLSINKCWVEDVTYLYEKDSTCGDVVEDSNNYVRMTKKDVSAETEVYGTVTGCNVYVHGATEQTPLQECLTRDKRITGASIYDKDNGTWGGLYGFYTNKGYYHAPFNTKVHNAISSTGTSLTIKDVVGSWVNVPVWHDIVVAIVGTDGSKLFYKGFCLQANYETFNGAIESEPFYSQTWDGADINTADWAVTINNGVVTANVAMGNNAKHITIIDRYTVLGAKLTESYEI